MASRVSIGAAAVLASVATASCAAAVREAPAAGVSAATGYDVYADVVKVEPRYVWRDVTLPVRECVEVAPVREADAWRRGTFRERYDADPAAGAAAGLVGGLLGGLIGHQFGHGDGRTALTVVGALLGSSIAREQAWRDPYEHGRRAEYFERRVPAQPSTHVRHCTERTSIRQVREADGYDVTYRYHGATLHKWVDEPPGDAVRVHVSVEPAGYVQ